MFGGRNCIEVDAYRRQLRSEGFELPVPEEQLHIKLSRILYRTYLPDGLEEGVGVLLLEMLSGCKLDIARLR